MPRGPQGEDRPADVIGCAVTVARIATGEIEDDKQCGRVHSGVAGGSAHAQKLPEGRRKAAKRAALAR